MRITGILPFGNSKYKIYIEDEFAFVLYKGELNKYGIKENIEFPLETYREIKSELLLKRGKLRAMNLLKNRDYTEYMLRRKLEEGLYPKDIIDEVLRYVMSFGYVDDFRYASDYIRCYSGGLSMYEIKHKLSGKGITNEVIDEAMSMSDFSQNMEAETIRNLVKKKCKNLNDIDDKEIKKIFGYLCRKGFSYDVIQKTLEEIRN